MKTVDWYTRLMLSIIAGSLLYLATAVHVANQAAANFYARVQPVATNVLSQPAATAVALRPQDGPIEVRIIGYKWDGKDRDFGTYYSSMRNGLPTCPTPDCQ